MTTLEEAMKHKLSTLESNSIKPGYYASNGKDLFDRFEEGLMLADEIRGFYKGNVFKYITRYHDKNGVEDLHKAKTYLERLIAFETQANRTDSEKMADFWTHTFKDWHEKGGVPRDTRPS